MTKFAKVVDEKIIDVVSGLQPLGYLPVTKNWTFPTDYPSEFYTANSNIPRLSVVDGIPNEDWSFRLKSIQSLKDHMYNLIKEKRKVKQLESFEFNGHIIPIGDRETSLLITSLKGKNVPDYKIDQNNWISLNSEESVSFVDAHDNHIQGAYTWERESCEAVKILNTYDELHNFIVDNL